jgi:hypothetical protein
MNPLQLLSALLSGVDIKSALVGMALPHFQKLTKGMGELMGGMPSPPGMAAQGGGIPPQLAPLLALAARSKGQPGGAPAKPPTVPAGVSPLIPRVTGMEQPLTLR